MKSCVFLGRPSWERRPKLLPIHVRQLAQLGVVTQKTSYSYIGGLATACLSRVPDLLAIDRQIEEEVGRAKTPPNSLLDLAGYVPEWLLNDIADSPQLCHNLGANLLNYIRERHETRSNERAD